MEPDDEKTIVKWSKGINFATRQFRLPRCPFSPTTISHLLSLAAQAIEPLWKHFPESQDQIKGDIIYILGEAKDPGVIPKLKTVAAGRYAASKCPPALLSAAKEIYCPRPICSESLTRVLS